MIYRKQNSNVRHLELYSPTDTSINPHMCLDMPYWPA